MTEPAASNLITQTKLAFDLQQRLYTECALLTRELELLFERETEHFSIARPAGYAVATRRSVGLDPLNVQMWPLREFAVMFVPGSVVKFEGGQTRTDFKERCIYMRFLLDDYGSTTFANETLVEPTIIYGTFTEVSAKKKLKKLEDILTHIEYNDNGVFARLPAVDFEDGRVRIVGTFEKVGLFSLVDSAAVLTQLANPALELYRRVHSS